MLLKDDAQAARLYEKCCRMNAMNPEMQNSYGNVLFRLGQINEAREHYQSAMNILKNRGGGTGQFVIS